MAGWPLIGRLVRITVAVIRLPHFRDEYLELARRQQAFELHQLPTLLHTVSDINQRLIKSDSLKDNLVKSVPVALRRITREVAELRRQVNELRPLPAPESLAQPSDTTRADLEAVADTVRYLLGRVEFVRRELMFELRYGASPPSDNAAGLSAIPEILSADKLATARRDGIRVNIGCGHIPLDGYLNVDRRALPGVDIVAEADQLPFGSGELDEIFSAHLLEHFPQEQLRRELLPYFLSLLKHGGTFRAVVPDAEAMIREYSVGRYPYSDLREVIYGSQDYDGDFHYNMFTPEALETLLLEAGFRELVIPVRGRKNGACFEFEITARREALPRSAQ